MLTKISNTVSVGNDTSSAFSLDLTDFKKVAIHAVLVAAAAGITALMDGVGHVNLGVYTPILIPVVYSVLESIRKYIQTNEPIVTEGK